MIPANQINPELIAELIRYSFPQKSENGGTPANENINIPIMIAFKGMIFTIPENFSYGWSYLVVDEPVLVLLRETHSIVKAPRLVNVKSIQFFVDFQP